MYIHSKILLKNAQSLLQDHKCHTCDDLLAVFKPYKVPSNAEHQKTWYQRNTEKCAKYDKHRYSKAEYQKSHQKSMQKYYFSKKKRKKKRGPIFAPGCSRVCPICVESLEKKKVPTLALANGLWVGEIPDELQDLTYAEQLLIARVHHNRCIVKVSSGMFKVRANAISFSNPMPKIYNLLPSP
jgi:hypothetical protein